MIPKEFDGLDFDRNKIQFISGGYQSFCVDIKTRKILNSKEEHDKIEYGVNANPIVLKFQKIDNLQDFLNLHKEEYLIFGLCNESVYWITESGETHIRWNRIYW